MSTTETEPSSEASAGDIADVLGVTIVHQASGELVDFRFRPRRPMRIMIDDVDENVRIDETGHVSSPRVSAMMSSLVMASFRLNDRR